MSDRLGSGDGYLTQSISILTTKDEFRNISINMNAFLEKIHGSIVSIKSNSHYQSILANELTNLTHLLREKTTESGDTATTTMQDLNIIRTLLEKMLQLLKIYLQLI